MWGAELLHVTPEEGYRRLGTFQGAPLPGGDAAVRRAPCASWRPGWTPPEWT